jgi:Ca2+-binding RTX toxin-like protein
MESAMAKIKGTNGNDILNGTDNDDEILGKKGNDTIRGKKGDDLLTGGADKDTYRWSEGDGYDTIISTGSAANEDTIAIDGSFYDFNWVRDGDDLLVGVVVDDNYDFADVGGVSRIQNFFTGGDSIDYLTADVGDNNIFYSPGGGDARIYVSAVTGLDQGNYAEAVLGTAGDDVITGGGGFKDFVFGDDGDDTLSVENGTIGILTGGNGDDIITGADQADTLRGSQGDDLIDGGSSSDDTVRFNNSPDGILVNLSDEAVTYDFNGTADVEVAAGHALDGFGTVDTILNVEHVRGSNFDDIIVGNAADNTIDPLEGNNLVLAGDGNDFITLSSNINNPGQNVIEGGAGDDIIDGGYGDDVHWGGPGDDQIFDGGASDVFIFKNSFDEGNDRIEFFHAGADFGYDVLDLRTFGFSDWTEAMSYAEPEGSDALFSFDNGTTLTLVDVALGDLGQNNFLITDSLLA